MTFFQRRQEAGDEFRAQHVVHGKSLQRHHEARGRRGGNRRTDHGSAIDGSRSGRRHSAGA